MREVINTDQAPNPVGPYNQAIAVNNMLFISGQIAIDPSTGEMIQETIEAETKQVMHNLGAILHTAKLDYADIVMCTVYVTDMGNYGRINTVYAEFFESDIAPARALVEATALPKGANVEISVIATLK
jgi:2-iminobutanoate/2-iminopropanoate deaminase